MKLQMINRFQKEEAELCSKVSRVELRNATHVNVADVTWNLTAQAVCRQEEPEDEDAIRQEADDELSSLHPDRWAARNGKLNWEVG